MILDTDESIYVRGMAATFLGGKKNGKKVTPHLIIALKDFELKIGSEQMTHYEKQAVGRIIRALGGTDNIDASNALVSLLKNKNAELEKASADGLKVDIYFALGDLGLVASEATPFLLDELKVVDNTDDKGILIENIGKIKDKRAVVHLLNELKNNDSYIRMRAAEALGRIGDPKAAVEIKQLLKRMDKEGRSDNDTAYKIVKDSYKNLTGVEHKRGL